MILRFGSEPARFFLHPLAGTSDGGATEKRKGLLVQKKRRGGARLSLQLKWIVVRPCERNVKNLLHGIL